MPINDPFKQPGIVDPFKREQEQAAWAEQVRPDGGNVLQRALIGMGRGFTDLGQGVQQLFRGDEYDAQVRDEMELYDRNMDGAAAGIGRFAGNVAGAALPAGGAVRGAQALGKAAQVASRLNNAGRAGRALTGRAGTMAAEGAVAGAVENAMLADAQGSGLGERLAEGAALGGAFGGALGGGMRVFDDVRDYQRGLMRGSGRDNPNILARNARGANESIDRAFQGSGPSARKADALQEATGIHLTPADRTGGRTLRFLENMASQSLVSADRVEVGRAKAGRQMVNYARRIMNSLAGQGDTVQAAEGLQSAVRNMTEEMAKRRTEEAGSLYRAIDQAAGGAPVVQLSNTQRAIDELVREYSVNVGHDAQKIAAQAQRFRKLLGDSQPKNAKPKINYAQGDINPLTGQPRNRMQPPEGPPALSAEKALRQLQAWSQASRGTGRLFDDVSPGADRYAAGKLYRALLADLDETAAQGGTVGDMVRQANDAWRQHSQQIDALENSILGDVVGQEFADEINGIAQNRMTPEKVLDRFRRANPKEIKVARDYLEKYAPEAWQQIKRAYVEEAVAVARSSTATQQTNIIEPAELIRQLTGGTTRKTSFRGRERLKAMFGDTEEWGMVQNLLNVAERKADGFGYNSSGTSPQEGARKLLGAMYGGGLTALGTIGEVAGLRRIADYMMPGARTPQTATQVLPYRQLPSQLGPVPLGGLAGLVGTNYVGQGDR